MYVTSIKPERETYRAQCHVDIEISFVNAKLLYLFTEPEYVNLPRVTSNISSIYIVWRNSFHLNSILVQFELTDRGESVYTGVQFSHIIRRTAAMGNVSDSCFDSLGIFTLLTLYRSECHIFLMEKRFPSCFNSHFTIPRTCDVSTTVVGLLPDGGARKLTGHIKSTGY